MKEPKVVVRYLGFQARSDGSRRFDFSFSGPDASQHMISVEAPQDLFGGPDHMSLQECPGICYETLKCHIAGCSAAVPVSISLTAADVAQHRRPGKRSDAARTHERVDWRFDSSTAHFLSHPHTDLRARNIVWYGPPFVRRPRTRWTSTTNPP